jgi:hypothetical protein
MKLTLQQKCDRRSKINRTARLRLGCKVSSIDHLAMLAANKRSVYCHDTWGLLPAIVVMNMIAGLVYLTIKRGRMFEYLAPASKRKARK